MLKAALQFIILVGTVVGLRASDNPVKMLTVCEVFADVDHYAGNAIAIIGRMESSVSLIDHYEFLSQDHCKRRIVAHGHVWPGKIQVWTFSMEEGMPKPPTDKPTLDRAVVAAKLATVVRLPSSVLAMSQAEICEDVPAPRWCQTNGSSYTGGSSGPHILMRIAAEAYVVGSMRH